jgi:hypothetical protein
LVRVRSARRITAWVTLPILLVAGIAQASVLYRCRMDGRTTRRSCCCGAAARERAPAHPTLSRASCCDTRVSVHTGLAAATARNDSQPSACTGPAALPTPAATAPPMVAALLKRATAPPRERPPHLRLTAVRLL